MESLEGLSTLGTTYEHILRCDHTDALRNDYNQICADFGIGSCLDFNLMKNAIVSSGGYLE